MRVLVVGTEDWAIEQAAGQLAATGAEVLTCHDPGQPAFPCNAVIPGRTCPLETGFDVAVTVRSRPLDHPAPSEMGAVCALRAGKPLVSAGMAGRNPFAGWSARMAAVDDLAAVAAELAEAEQKTSPSTTETAVTT